MDILVKLSLSRKRLLDFAITFLLLSLAIWSIFLQSEISYVLAGLLF